MNHERLQDDENKRDWEVIRAQAQHPGQICRGQSSPSSGAEMDFSHHHESTISSSRMTICSGTLSEPLRPSA